ncbi:MAG TPA: hypothetical protein VNG51_01405 [Ktedonobacteraceae bacterium]|nr:hypothetical protein [Ktedonobacteraceae bacterium]
MAAKIYYALGWFALLLMAAIPVAAWLYPQEVLTGAPQNLLIAWEVVVGVALVASFAMRKR